MSPNYKSSVKKGIPWIQHLNAMTDSKLVYCKVKKKKQKAIYKNIEMLINHSRKIDVKVVC